MPFLPATVVSGSFGFGLPLAPYASNLVRALAGDAGRVDHHVRFTLSPSDPQEHPRLGKEVRLFLRRRSFKRVSATLARIEAHPGAFGGRCSGHCSKEFGAHSE